MYTRTSFTRIGSPITRLGRERGGDTNTTEVDERQNGPVPEIPPLIPWLEWLQWCGSFWVAVCPPAAQSTDAPYIMGRTVYCSSEWRQIMTYSRGESAEGQVLWFKIWSSNYIITRSVVVCSFSAWMDCPLSRFSLLFCPGFECVIGEVGKFSALVQLFGLPCVYLVLVGVPTKGS